MSFERKHQMLECHIHQLTRARAQALIAALFVVLMSAGCSTTPEMEPTPQAGPIETMTLVIEVETAEWEGEMLYIAVYQSEDSFLEIDQWVEGVTVPVTVPITRLVFENVPALPTAVSGFIDIKRDETLTRNLIGLPVEPWGFTNDISVFFSRPTFDSTQVPATPPETHVRFAMGTSLDRSDIRRARAEAAKESDSKADLP